MFTHEFTENRKKNFSGVSFFFIRTNCVNCAVRKHCNRPSTPGSLYQMQAEGIIQYIYSWWRQPRTKCDTCRSTECVSHWRAGVAALILFSFLMSNIKSETLMQHWGNATVRRCRMIISDAPAWSGVMPSREDIAVRPPDGSASVGSSADLKKKKPRRSWTRRSLIAAASVQSAKLADTF